jgi:protein-disulfide isomerase
MRLFPLALVLVLASAAQVGAQTLVRPDSPSLGPENAPVAVVLFCDFQCPQCAEAAPAVEELAAARPRDVRIVYRHFPIQRIHPDADEAAEGAACAQEQGQFWPMYSSLLRNQGRLDFLGMGRQARELGLNGAAFDRCLRSGRHQATWRRDVADAAAAGVTGTPTFFVNGRAVEGALTFGELDLLVRSALGQ